jgi:16S rRNA (cytidine1402-2'-O)-methyltransferase
MRTTLQGAVDYYRDNEPRGEYVLVVGGAQRHEGPAMTMEEGVARVMALREGGMRMKDAVRQVSADTGLNKNELYDAALKV